MSKNIQKGLAIFLMALICGVGFAMKSAPKPTQPAQPAPAQPIAKLHQS